MSIRKLIEQALEEARDEFAAIIARKVAEVMGDVAEPARKGRPAKTPPHAGKRAGLVHERTRKRTRAPQRHMEELRGKVLAALESGKAMKRAQIVAAARLDASEAGRVAQVLRRLKDEGLLAMQGQKASATYTLRSGGG